MSMVKQLDPNRKLDLGLSQPYLEIYVAQKNRPEKMSYFENLVAIGGIGRVEQIYNEKESRGAIAVGSFCVYSPEELVLAVGGIHYSLCSGTEVATEEAEKIVPRNTCALIKALVGFRASGKCPYMQISDMIIGETTCDGKKKAYEAFDEISPTELYVMALPNVKNEEGRVLWINELKRCAKRLEALSGNKITVESLRKAFELTNNKRAAQLRLQKLRGVKPSPISGLDALLVNQLASSSDIVEVTHAINELCDELDLRVANHFGVEENTSKRLIIGGSPMAMPNWKIHNIIESAGAVVVGEESCTGVRAFKDLLDTSFTTLDEAYELLADRHLNVDCACFTPNHERPVNINKMVKEHQADGFVHYSLQFCTPFMMESFKIKKTTEAEDIPFLKIETDYSKEDIGQLKTRIEAFIEML